MLYGKPYTYFLGKPNGTANTLWGSLALFTTAFVPFLGQIVVLGYQAEVAEDLERDPDLADYPDFTTDRLTKYFLRGLYPLLMQILVGLAAAALMIGAVVVGAVVAAASDQPLVGAGVGLLLVFPLLLLAGMLTWPLTLHAQLTQDFLFGDAVGFTREFVRRVGGQLFVSLVVHTLISIPLTIAGFLLCFVGLYPAMMVQLMAQEHYMIQLYRLYLDEGGAPIRRPEARRRERVDEYDDED